MPTGSTLSEQLAILGVQLPAWPEEPEGNPPEDDWIQRGQAYADVARLWRSQLSHASEATRAVVLQLLRHLADRGSLTAWELWLASAIHPGLPAQEEDESWIFTAAAYAHGAMRPAQLLGAILSVAGEDAWAFAGLAAQALLSSNAINAEDVPRALSMIIASACGSAALADDEHRDVGDWLAATQAQAAMASALKSASQWLEPATSDAQLQQERHQFLQRLASWFATAQRGKLAAQRPLRATCLEAESARQLIDRGQRQQGIKRFETIVQKATLHIPEGVSGSAWRQLLMNASTCRKDEPARLILIESKSLPRSGHHYLKNALQELCPNSFSYCEQYHEPGCCKVFPCNAEPYWHQARLLGKPHLRFTKSHDLLLLDPIHATPPGLIRLVQVRQPFDLLCSYLELAQLDLNAELLQQHGISLDRLCLYHEKELLSTAYSLIDDLGLVMHPDEAREWITSQTNYILGFTHKWLPRCQPYAELDAANPSGTYLLRYEQLDGVARGLANLANRTINNTGTPGDVTTFTPRRNSSLKRQASLITALLETVCGDIAAAERTILKSWQHFALLSDYQETASAERPDTETQQTLLFDADCLMGKREIATGKRFQLTSAPADYAISGIVSPSSTFFFHTDFNERQAITIDLESPMELEFLVITNRLDACFERARHLFWRVHDEIDDRTHHLSPILTSPEFLSVPASKSITALGGAKGRFISIVSRAATVLHFAAVEVYAR